MERSIDLSANIEATGSVRIIAKTLSLSGSAAQMSLDVITNVDIENRRAVAHIPECLAPSKTYFTTGRCLTGGDSQGKGQSRWESGLRQPGETA